MNIYCYGDSNTQGYKPNVEGYSKDAIPEFYPADLCWWYPLANGNKLTVNGLCGRCINKENKWLEGRNASLDIVDNIQNQDKIDIVIVQLGTNDCKSGYNCTAEEITKAMRNFIQQIKGHTTAKIILLSPAKIIENNKVTQKYYKGAQVKSEQLDIFYKYLADDLGLAFVSCVDAETGEDGEHLTPKGHEYISKKVFEKVKSIQDTIQNNSVETDSNLLKSCDTKLPQIR